LTSQERLARLAEESTAVGEVASSGLRHVDPDLGNQRPFEKRRAIDGDRLLGAVGLRAPSVGPLDAGVTVGTSTVSVSSGIAPVKRTPAPIENPSSPSAPKLNAPRPEAPGRGRRALRVMSSKMSGVKDEQIEKLEPKGGELMLDDDILTEVMTSVSRSPGFPTSS
jgi:hypothetical protein